MDQTTSETIYGYSTPRIYTPSLELPSAGQVVSDLADELGIPLLPWQRLVIDDALQVRSDGSWARGQVGVLVARQNGKTHLARMRILAGLYIFGEASIVAMAQTRQLALDTFKQVVDLAESSAWMRKRIKRVSRTNGQEEIEVYCHHYPKPCEGKCARIRKYTIRAATSEGPRGSTADLLYIDELREINEATWAAARPLTRARPNAQMWTTSNAGDATSTVLNGLRATALQMNNPRLGWYEYSAENDDVHDLNNWRQANPALGHTVSLESLQDSAATDTRDAVLTEMLCRWVSALDSPWPMDHWADAADENLMMRPDLPTWMALDINFNRDKAYLVTVQQIDDEQLGAFVHVFENYTDVKLASEIAGLARQFRAKVLSYDPNTAGFIAPMLERGGIPVQPMPWGSSQFAIACDQTKQAMMRGILRHPAQEIMQSHLVACTRRPASDGGWRIARRDSATPISAAVALAMAVGHASTPQPEAQIIVV